MTFPRRLLFFTCLHTLFLLPVLGMNACLAFSDSEYPSFWYAAADLLAAFLCLPLWPLLSIGRLDLFLILIPANSLVYGLIFALPLHLYSRKRMVSPA